MEKFHFESASYCQFLKYKPFFRGASTNTTQIDIATPWSTKTTTTTSTKTNDILDNKILSFLYENMNGLTKQNKTNDVLVSSSIADYDVIAISESWLNASIKDCEFMFDDYIGEFMFGVLIAVKK